jgi:GNAT superfamily N-acetyltransferase
LNFRTINPSDFDFIIDLALSEGIRYTRRDLTRILDYEPDGCFIAVENEKKLGIVSTIVFGKVGWIGNLFVAKSSRRHGAGTKLVKEALRYMQNKGVEYPKLYCYPHRVTFYKRLGFLTEIKVQVLNGHGREIQYENVEGLTEDSMDELIALDERLFGANRLKVLRIFYDEFKEYCFTTRVDGRMVGYIMASGAEDEYELGPWICEPRYQDEFVEELLKAEMNRLTGKRIELSSPMHNTLVERVLKKYDLQQKGIAIRMGYGKRVPIGNIEGILGIGGLDRG